MPFGLAMGRLRVLLSEEEERAYKDRRRAQQRVCVRKRREAEHAAAQRGAADGVGSMASIDPPLTDEERARLERQRQQKLECEYRRRAKMTDEDRAADATRKLVAFVVKMTASLVLHLHVK